MRSAPALGFGVTGPHATVLVRPRETIALIQRAVQLGVALFDTAPFHGRGEAERRLGEALAGVPADRVFLSTKVGKVEEGLGKLGEAWRPDAVRASVEASLKRLGRDRLDALFLHGPAPRHLTDALLSALSDMRATGMVGSIGLCARDDGVDAAASHDLFDLLMTPAHAHMAEPARSRLARARKAGLGVLGVETLSPARQPFRPPTRPADLWYLARALRPGGGRDAPPGARLSPAECLEHALGAGLADTALITTVRRAHLEACALAVRHALA
ncbi:MAG: aldo/keto reductase [Caulobacterales bacterium]|nr:aldo/keto reductase [Caulobacterales bacterium]